MGFCEIETDSSSCSCKKSCFIEKNCCPEIGCSRMFWHSYAFFYVNLYQSCAIFYTAKNCAEAGLDAGCCTGNCNVTYGTNRSETCYCDDRCRVNEDCCEDVDQTKECNPSCTLTISNLKMILYSLLYLNTLLIIITFYIVNPQTDTQEERPKLSPLQLAVSQCHYRKHIDNVYIVL